MLAIAPRPRASAVSLPFCHMIGCDRAQPSSANDELCWWIAGLQLSDVASHRREQDRRYLLHLPR